LIQIKKSRKGEGFGRCFFKPDQFLCSVQCRAKYARELGDRRAVGKDRDRYYGSGTLQVAMDTEDLI